MSTESIDRQTLRVSLQKAGITRLALSITLVFILGLSGVLTITFASWAGKEASDRSFTYSDVLRSNLHPVSTPTPSPTPTPTPSPIPSPTGPLPPYLSQAIATLQAQNRLLYGGNAYLPEIALTFDDGPNPYYTPEILSILQQYKVKATFFCVGRLVAAYPALVKQEYEVGHVIGNHSWSHPNLALLPPAYIQYQITNTSDAIQAAIGVRPTFFRPPYGIMSVQVLTQAYHLGLTTIIWNDEGRDWQRPGVDVIIQRIFRLARDGAIILMHDGGGDRSQTVAALPYIIQGLRQSGFQLVTIQRMILDLHKDKSAATNGTAPSGSAMPSITSAPRMLSTAWRREPGV